MYNVHEKNCLQNVTDLLLFPRNKLSPSLPSPAQPQHLTGAEEAETETYEGEDVGPGQGNDGVVEVAGAGPDVVVKEHHLLLQRELGPGDLHPAGEHRLQGQAAGLHGGVHHHVVHQTSLDGGGRGLGMGWSAE